MAESDVQQREKLVREYWENNGRIYVDKGAFDKCFTNIKHWLSASSLVGYMMQNGLVTSPSDTELITSPYLPPDQRLKNLLQLAEGGGKHGYFALYMCIRESRRENPYGHGDAVAELENWAKQLKSRPPWEVHTGGGSPDDGSDPGPQSSNPDKWSGIPESGGSDGDQLPLPPSGSLHHGIPESGGSGSDQLSEASPGPYKLDHNIRSSAEEYIKTTKYKDKDAKMNVATGMKGTHHDQEHCSKLDGASNTVPSVAVYARPQLKQPVQETNLQHGDDDDDVVEKDRPPPTTGQDSQVPQAPSLYAIVKGEVSQGAVDVLSNKYENEVDLDFVSDAECTNKSKFMDAVCRFVVAILNSRDSDKMGVLLAGINTDDTQEPPFTVSGIPFDDKIRKTINEKFCVVLGRTVLSRLGKSETKFSSDESNLVKLEFMPVSASASPPTEGAQPASPQKQVALVTVQPSWRVCANKLYMCRFVDDGGKPKTEIFKRSEGGSVSVRFNKVSQLQNTLNNKFEEESSKF